MRFLVYLQQQVLASEALTDFLLDTIIENLSYLYGEGMGNEENRKEWIEYNLKTENPTWRAIVGISGGKYAGFLLYSIDHRDLIIHDLEIVKAMRFHPPVLAGLFRTLFHQENGKFDCISGYINKGNLVSQQNFLKYATSVVEGERGYMLMVDGESTAKIMKKFEKRT